MIENKTKDYSSHKHNFNVYVEINSKTRLGQDLLEQYHKQAKNQYIDIGRIGRHDEHGKYIIDYYTLAELITIPKLIISVIERAVDRAGKDVYKLRTYMSKFGQLNFLLLVDRSYAELILVENIFIENLNHKEDYETSIYKLRYSPREHVPLREIFYKFGIKANPDDYGKSWKDEQSSINNVIVAKAKAEMTISIANKIASNINQKALITSLNYLNKENTYGKNVTKEYSKQVAKSKELNKLTTSPKLENTLNNVLVKTLDQQTTKVDVKDKTNFKVYKKVLAVEFSSHNEIKKEVDKANNKQNLKEFMLDTYSNKYAAQEDENKINEEKFKTFENIIEKHYSHVPNKEAAKPIEEDFKAKEIAAIIPEKEKKQEFYDFDNKKVEIDFNLDRFKKPEEESKKREKKKQEKIFKKQEKKQNKINKKQNKNLKILDAECDLDREFERSKQTLGILPTDSKKKKKKALNKFFSEDTKKQKKENKKQQNNLALQEENKTSIIEKIEKQIRLQKDVYNKDKTKQEKLESKKTKKLINKKNKKLIKQNKKLYNELSKEDTNFLKEYQIEENPKVKNKIAKKEQKQKLKETNQSKPVKIKKNRDLLLQRLEEKQEKKKKKNAQNLILDLEDKKDNKKPVLVNTNAQKTNESVLNSAKTAPYETKLNTQNQSGINLSSSTKTKNEHVNQEVFIKPAVEKTPDLTPKKSFYEQDNTRSEKETQLQNFFTKKQPEQQYTNAQNSFDKNIKQNNTIPEFNAPKKKPDLGREM